jgi:hypothetical protein
MDVGGLLILIVVFTLAFLLIQRAERKRRLLVAVFVAILLLLTQRYANYREYHTEAIVALILALVFNGLFWIIIGRYNSPPDSDEMKVLGMDD